MRLLARQSDRFFSPVHIIGGPQTRAIIQTTSESDQPNREMSATRTIARVRPDSLLKVGDVIFEPKSKGYFLCGSHPTVGEYKVFRLFPCNKFVPWARMQTVNDTLTGLPKSTTPVNLETHWVVRDMITREPFDLTIRIGDQKGFILTGKDVQLGDILDGETVKRVNIALGLRAVEVQ
jgi:hypothetical protein